MDALDEINDYCGDMIPVVTKLRDVYKDNSCVGIKKEIQKSGYWNWKGSFKQKRYVF